MSHTPRFYHRPDPNAGRQPAPNLPLNLRPAAAAREAGISERLLWSLTKQGLVPYAKLVRCTVYPTAAFIRWIEEQTIHPIVRRSDEVGGDNGTGVNA